MHALEKPLRCGLAVALSSLAACTVIDVDARKRPAGLEADGLVDGHVAFGVSGETSALRVQLLGSRSDGSLLELAVWKLLRFEIGLAGLDVGLGPIDVGLGVLFYDPALPPQPPRARRAPAREPEPPPAGAAPADPAAPPAPAPAAPAG
jgi:hypothetical protein